MTTAPLLRRLAAGFLGLVAMAAPAAADTVLEMSTVYTGSTPTSKPAGTAPWGTATFEDLAANTVRLTMQLDLQAASEFVSNWYFSLDPSLQLDKLSVAYVSDQTATATIAAAQDGINVAGGYSADIKFDFPNPAAQRFKGTESSVWDFTYAGAGTFDAGSFLSFLGKSGADKPDFYSAMHVQGLAGGESVHVGGLNVIPPAVVPEPSSVALIGLGVLGLGLAHLRGRRATRA